ncbi:MAG TPA: alpha/beta fold hydrolase [Gaiellaceae bacterium]|nr:alpha/beta fold hydrolase [Gaiellaceae bacterium]
MRTTATPGVEGFVERQTPFGAASVRYLAAGSGPPVVLVHGLGGAAPNWRLIAPDLARDHRVLIPELPGHGGSDALHAATLDPFADAVLAVLDAEGAVPAAWVGHSLGGSVALRAALRRPDAVRGVVLVAAAGITSTTNTRIATATMHGFVRAGKVVTLQRRRLARSPLGRTLAFGYWGVADPVALEPEMAEAFLEGPSRHTNTSVASRALVATDSRLELDRVQCPCLCLWGVRDNWVPLADGFEYARRLRAPLRTIADCGHLLIGERPDAVLRAIREFLAGLG